MTESIASAYSNAQTKVTTAFAAVGNKGGTVPSSKTLSNLPAAISSIPSADSAYLEKTINYAAKITSGTSVIFSQAELLAAKIITSTSQEFSTQWSNYFIEVWAVQGQHTASTNQLVWTMASNAESPYSATATYKRHAEYRNTSATASTAIRTAYSIATATAGYLSSSASNGVIITTSSTYGLGIGTYRARIVVWGKK